jgi:hypothetical protein
VEALILAMLDGHHALYKVGCRIEERGVFPLLQPGLGCTAVHDYRLGRLLDALVAANLNGGVVPWPWGARSLCDSDDVAPSGYDHDHTMLAMLTVVGLLVYALIQRQVR